MVQNEDQRYEEIWNSEKNYNKRVQVQNCAFKKKDCLMRLRLTIGGMDWYTGEQLENGCLFVW
jgi:hypothetical protein